MAGGAGFGVEAFNRQLHKQQEIPVLEKKAEELYKTLGAPRSSALWLDLLMIAAGGALDAADEARLSGLVAQSTGNDPQSRNFIDDLNIAKGIIGQLAAEKIPLKWGDGSQVVANGEKVFAFRATENQFNDSTLFNASVLHGQGVVYEQWRQYGQEQTSAHSKEMGALSSTESAIKSATQRLSDLAGKGITTIAPEFDAAMLLMPAGKGAKVVVEAVLAKLAAGKAAAGVGPKGAKAIAPKATAEGKIGGQAFTDVNQTARPGSQAKADQPTLISDRVNTKIESSGKPLPNANMATAHAEIGVIQQAYNAGKTQGAAMTLKVEGQAVCGYCRGDIAAAAEKSGLKSLEINEVATGKTLYWKPGMRSIKELD